MNSLFTFDKTPIRCIVWFDVYYGGGLGSVIFILLKNQNTGYLMDIAFIFDRCRGRHVSNMTVIWKIEYIIIEMYHENIHNGEHTEWNFSNHRPWSILILYPSGLIKIIVANTLAPNGHNRVILIKSYQQCLYRNNAS